MSNARSESTTRLFVRMATSGQKATLVIRDPYTLSEYARREVDLDNVSELVTRLRTSTTTNEMATPTFQFFAAHHAKLTAINLSHEERILTIGCGDELQPGKGKIEYLLDKYPELFIGEMNYFSLCAADQKLIPISDRFFLALHSFLEDYAHWYSAVDPESDQRLDLDEIKTLTNHLNQRMDLMSALMKVTVTHVKEMLAQKNDELSDAHEIRCRAAARS